MPPVATASTTNELLTFLSSSDCLPPLLERLDDFLTRATAQQIQVDPLLSASNDSSRGEALDTADVAAVELLVRRLLYAAPAVLAMAVDCGLLHVSRLLPLCQLLRVSNARAVAALLDALVENVAAFSTLLTQVQQLYCQQLTDVYDCTVQLSVQKQDQDVTQLSRRCYELSLSLNGMTTATSVTKLLLLLHNSNDNNHKDGPIELLLHNESLLYGLVRCYEVVVPTLHRQLGLVLDDGKTTQPHLLMIAKIRQTLLQVLGRCVDVMLDETTSIDAEKLLAGLHALSDGCVDEVGNAEHGSFVSDLWHLCGYKEKVAACFQRCEFDLEHYAYLGMVMDGLPRRRILPAMLVNDLAAESKRRPTAVIDSKDCKPSGISGIGKATSPGVSLSDTTDAVLVSMIHQVQDFFPDLGEGYVELCLLSANVQVETVVDFLLERNPPPMLLGVSQDLKRTDPEFARLKAQITGKAAPEVEADHSTMLHPSQVWVGKKTMEKTYDPQSVKKDGQLYEKMKELVMTYEDEDDSDGDVDRVDNAVGGLDEYDDDYNDEFDDFVRFTIRDAGSADDQDTIREQNRKIRAKEEKDAFWEGMKNRNRESSQVSADDRQRDDDGGQEKDLGEQKVSGTSSGSAQVSSDSKHRTARRKGSQPSGESRPSEALTPQQIQRQRARKDKNKAKVANHNRKDRAMKKAG
ncbi:unnamed protein product [Hyaloperonospora brassicae]|uniref:CUE domain-containing protein n=1 Tax=Hyaloperonospora brassicae TaxID=162125 RepID=A0AAV0UQF0_HYABA|nr:unnamed protein product [Hyaloperonospora brassicae]